jgi:hypothetical protein
MVWAEQVRENMEVVAADGKRVGTVDHMDGTSRIMLSKTNSDEAIYHEIPLEWVERVDGQVHLAKDAAYVRVRWTELG